MENYSMLPGITTHTHSYTWLQREHGKTFPCAT